MQYRNVIRKKAVNGITMELTNGVYGLLGTNRAGKTTLMRMVCGGLRCDGGEILCDGEEILSMGERFRKQIGYLPQDFGYYPNFSVMEFMGYIASLKGISHSVAVWKSKVLLQKVGLEKQHRTKIKALSGGMRQRLLMPGGLPCLFFCLIADAQLCEEGFQQRTALLLQYPSGDGYLVVELGHLQEIQDGAAAACLGVHTAHDHLGDAGLDDGTGAHLAGLQRHIEGAFLQPPVADLLAGFVDGGDLRVGQCILVRIPAVIPPADDLTLVDNDAADGYFSQCIGFLRLPQGFPHVFFCNIRNHRHIYTLHFVDIFQRVVYHNHRQIRGICVCFKE